MNCAYFRNMNYGSYADLVVDSNGLVMIVPCGIDTNPVTGRLDLRWYNDDKREEVFLDAFLAENNITATDAEYFDDEDNNHYVCLKKNDINFISDLIDNVIENREWDYKHPTDLTHLEEIKETLGFLWKLKYKINGIKNIFADGEVNWMQKFGVYALNTSTFFYENTSLDDCGYPVLRKTLKDFFDVEYNNCKESGRTITYVLYNDKNEIVGYVWK